MPIVPSRRPITYSGTTISPGGAGGGRAPAPGFDSPVTPSAGSASRVDVGRQRGDVAEVAVLLAVVQAVPDDELVGDVPADVRRLDRHRQRLGLAEQRRDLDAGGVAAAEAVDQPAQ